jgi:hypothetical protein
MRRICNLLLLTALLAGCGGTSTKNGPGAAPDGRESGPGVSLADAIELCAQKMEVLFDICSPVILFYS